MKLIPFLVVLSLAALEAAANPLHREAVHSLPPLPSKRTVPLTHVRHEKRTLGQGSAWSKVKRAKSEAVLPMRIGLKQANLMSGHDLLMDM
jgi:tripeptidyl-peptidase-1